MPYARRAFLKTGALFVSMSLTMPSFLAATIDATSDRAISAGGGRRRTLVVVQLGGGNDGLNTVVPHGDAAYYAARRVIGIPKSQVLDLNGYVGLHPSLSALKTRFDQGEVAVVQGVGYPNPNRSHFRAMDIWQSGVPERVVQTGWLGRYVDAACCGQDQPLTSSLGAMSMTDTAPLTLWTEHVLVPTIGSLSTFKFQTDDGEAPDERLVHLDTFREIYSRTASPSAYDDFVRRVGRDALDTSEQLQRIASTYAPSVTYPTTSFANQLKQVAQIMSGDLGTRIFYVQLGGFDTHSAQLTSHAALLKTLADGVDAFLKDLDTHGRADDVALLCFSEFGRRVAENGSAGTDHGAAAPVFLIGRGVQGGLLGQHPSLTSLSNGDLRFTVDFRSVYAGVLRDWLDGDPAAVLGKTVTPMSFLRTFQAVPPPAPGMTRTYVPVSGR
jgi:uncharacterized protein (DUF1501 family)